MPKFAARKRASKRTAIGGSRWSRRTPNWSRPRCAARSPPRSKQVNRDIALIAKEGERERTDIERFLAREQAERDREIALAAKTRELEIAETKRLASTADRERAEHTVESVRVVADAERTRQVEIIVAGKAAEARRIDEESKAAVTRMHALTQSETRKARRRA